MSFQRTALVAVGIIGTDPRKEKFGDPLKRDALLIAVGVTKRRLR